MAQKLSDYAIETIGLTKIFPDWWGRAKVIAVEDLDLAINHNEVYGLLGPNGSGKTTTLKILLGLLHPSKGKSLILGSEPSDPKVKDRIGYLPEESYLYKYLSARETLDFYGRIFGIPGPVRKARIDSLLEMVGLAGMANRPVGTFSKGMARRIGLAQALINDPELLILDEPTSGMDPIGTRQMKDLIVELAKRGKTILLCSHLLADVEDVCDRIGILYGGKMRTEGNVSDLLKHTEKRQITTGKLSEEAVEKIRQIVSEENESIDVEYPMDKLEDFFVRTVNSAVEENKYTSGAMSTTALGDFLVQSEKQKKDLLDKLVSADVDSQKGDGVTDKVEQAAAQQTPSEPRQKQPDRDLLKNLAGSAGSGETEKSEPAQAGIGQTEPVENKPDTEEKKPEPNKNVLDELMGKKTGDGSTDKTDAEGDSGNG